MVLEPTTSIISTHVLACVSIDERRYTLDHVAKCNVGVPNYYKKQAVFDDVLCPLLNA